MKPQQLSLPENTLFYISKHPKATPSLHQNLAQSCKYFYAKNPIIFLDYILVFSNEVTLRYKREYKPYPALNVNQVFCKFWVTQNVEIRSLPDFAIDVFREKILHFNDLNFFMNPVKFDDISFFKNVKSIKNVSFYEDYEDSNETPIPLEKIFECFPNMEGLK